ncbi:hypothetical protein QRZ09_25795 [Klebsiella quasipneumoniae]|uniref:hypothetical protein n=1 Tax=Klebsiella quasipneumoniae TaxID=1463165 RepID=UPI00255AD553|nr:hypothetical protein [Klebsiella quasipneumoniae]MDL4569819.1 hypothetical protein [Klebsiella quasipneumoniae]MDL4590429.1 hypothetical protein [Klebsiella quasipneumoniae]MDL4595467.1 hypothetical protein [Klebsiella quasipneumoniae]MDL4629902.1 hypothetical protein [Klebsiella quasipneumoniae]MDL4650042.1 hypothetical protein [Klebsiella quasipneumoniae]
MNRDQFSISLSNLKKSDWERFEELSSSFLSVEFAGLRTMASPSGDGGRDSEIFNPNGVSHIAIQYSVTDNYEDKIKRTVKKLKDNFKEVTLVIYCTNIVIGAKGDKIKAACMLDNIYLDIRDANWFLERFESDEVYSVAAKRLFDAVGRPVLEDLKLIETEPNKLSSVEAKAALTFLGLQWSNEDNGKGLTKIAFESLVRAALRNTNSSNRMKRVDIHKTIMNYLPTTNKEDIVKYVDAALSKLVNKTDKKNSIVKIWDKDDEFCLSYEEIQRIEINLEKNKVEESIFNKEVSALIVNEVSDGDVSDDTIEFLTVKILKVLDRFLFNSGEEFALSVIKESIIVKNESELKNCIFEEIDQEGFNLPDFPDIALNVISHILNSRSRVIIQHLKKASDIYTLFSFLKETPDIQKVTRKIFSYGTIWLDTTIVLPLLVESIYKDEKTKKFTETLLLLNDSGIKLKVTEGVVDEIIQHINLSKHCSRTLTSEWSGRIPFLYYHYLEEGHNPSDFSSFIELFHGEERKFDDMTDYLNRFFKIQVESLYDASQEVDEEVRFSIESMWRRAHETRRSNVNSDRKTEPHVTDILIRNDVENYLGVIGKRRKETSSELGYKHWWLTTDKLAWMIRRDIREKIKNPPSSPLMSLNFISVMLSFSTIRHNIKKDDRRTLPLFFNIDSTYYMPKDLIDIANEVRMNNKDKPEHIIRRKVRDACDHMKRRYGKYASSGNDIMNEILDVK